jgi:DNA primase
LVAFDADKAGEKMAWRVAGEVLGVKRMVPAVGKDWNERLLAEQHPKRVQAEQQDRQMFRTLWKWYRVAGEVGHQEAYLKRITEVAQEVVDGKGLSEKAGQAMVKDLRRIEPMPIQNSATSSEVSSATEALQGI